jgi:hypothetical protein
MKSNDPPPSESRTRREVAARSMGLCELGYGQATEMSHRLAAGRGGTWTPANIQHLSSYAHRWATLNPAAAYAAGVFVESGADPARVPMWLARPWPGWWLARYVDEGPHVLEPVDHDALGLPAVPVLPAARAA